MRRWTICFLALLGLANQSAAAEPGVVSAIAPSGTIRAAYIVNNLAQEMGRRNALPVAILPIATVAAVPDAVAKGDADIGFVTPNPDRMGVVRYSRAYMRVPQCFLVPEASPIQSVAKLDRPGVVIGANTADSSSVYIKTNFKRAKVLESPDFALKEAVRCAGGREGHRFRRQSAAPARLHPGRSEPAAAAGQSLRRAADHLRRR